MGRDNRDGMEGGGEVCVYVLKGGLGLCFVALSGFFAFFVSKVEESKATR